MSRTRRTTERSLSLFSFQDIITSVTGVMVLLTLLMALELIERVLASPPQQTTVQIEHTGQSLAEMRSEIVMLRRQLASANTIATALPSFDATKLQQERQALEVNSQRLRRELVELNDRAVQKQQQLANVEASAAAERESEIGELKHLEERNSELRETLEAISSSNRVFFKKDKDGKATWLVEISGNQIAAAEIGVSAKPQRFNSQHEFENWLTSLSPHSTAFYLIVKPDGTEQFRSYKESIRSNGFDLGFHVTAADQQVIDPDTGAGVP
jgi:hypothetical protein